MTKEMIKGEENLIPFNKRTEDEQREIRVKGGKASGAARREKRDILMCLRHLLESPDSSGQTGSERLAAKLLEKALNEEGDIQAIKEILDRVYGKANQPMSIQTEEKAVNSGLSAMYAAMAEANEQK